MYTLHKNPLLLKDGVIYKNVLDYSLLYNLFFKWNTRFYIYVTLILECYMKCILEHSFNNKGKLKVNEYFEHTN